MRIVIVGIGQTGKELAKELIRAKHEVIVVDTDKELVEDFTDQYDAIGVVGSGVSKSVQLKAKVNYADALISLTSIDEVNLMSCAIAKANGAQFVMAKVSSEEYKQESGYFKNTLGIDVLVNPEQDTAKEIMRLVGYPSLIKTDVFANGRVDIAELVIREGNPLANRLLNEIRLAYETDLLVAGIVRKDKLIIPKGDIRIEEGDIVYVIASNLSLFLFLNKLKLIDKPIRSVFLIGCGDIGRYLLKDLSKMRIKVKVIDFDVKRCQALSEEFREIEIVHGDGVDSEILLEEGIKDYDCCISLTGADETNLVSSMFAWSCEVKKIITKIKSVSYTNMLHNVTIDTTISPHSVILSTVIRYLRGLKDGVDGESAILSLYRFAEDKAEVIEFEATQEFEKLGIELKNMKFKKGILIAFIVRFGDVIMPKGDTTMEEKDRIIVIAEREKKIAKLEDILEVD